GANDDRVEVEAGRGRVPAAVVDAAEQAHDVQRVDTAGPGDAVLPVGREGHVAVAQGTAGAHLGGLLPEQRRPDAELALALEGGRLDVPAADQREVAVEAAQLVLGQVDRVVRVLHPLALGGEQLDQVRLLRQVGCVGPGYRVDHLGGLAQSG